MYSTFHFCTQELEDFTGAQIKRPASRLNDPWPQGLVRCFLSIVELDCRLQHGTFFTWQSPGPVFGSLYLRQPGKNRPFDIFAKVSPETSSLVIKPFINVSNLISPHFLPVSPSSSLQFLRIHFLYASWILSHYSPQRSGRFDSVGIRFGIGFKNRVSQGLLITCLIL